MPRIILFALALLFVIPAQADVVYRWQTVDAQGTTTPIGGQLVVTDEAWRQGQVNYLYYPCIGLPMSQACTGDPEAPVLLLEFYVNNETRKWTRHEYRTNWGFEDGQTSRVNAVFGDVLDGTIGSGGSYAAVQMASDGAGLWTVSELSTDRYPSDPNRFNCWGDVCTGVTGRWVLDAASIPVPTPGTLGLFGLGLAALAVTRRRRQ